MFNALFLAASFLGSPIEDAKPAFFEINVDARTPYSLFLNGDPIEANTRYKTKLTKLVCVEIEIRYVCGEEVVTRKFFMDLKPGCLKSITITISSRPSCVWC
jgi:hypothetical protein